MASTEPVRKLRSGSRERGLLCQRPKLTVIIIAMIVVASTYLLQDNSWHDLYLHERANGVPLAKVGSLEFVKYIPSELEKDWWHQRQIYQADPSKICQDLDKYSDKVSRWISSTQDNDIPDQSVFSKLQYMKNNGEKVSRMIEPLVGHFRHPFALQHCKPASKPAVDVQDRTYIAFGGLQELDKNVYPGKKYLFDLGTADFATSIGYFISTYHGLGIDFDRIWAWEAGPRPDYWKSVPDEVQGRLHFYNYPISSDTQSPSHPLEILKSIYMPGDYIVFKLDIDNSDLEMAIMEAIRKSQELRSMISEFMFEMHYDSRDMQRYFGRPNMTYIQTLESLRAFRESGVFLHYWP